MQITEQWILAHAPSPAVAEDGRAISEAERFLTRRRDLDALTFWGECAGSARNPYYVSVDCSLSEKEPVYSCSCPSRHFPCKHTLALLYDILAEKPFDIENPPGYVLRARTREAQERRLAAARLEKARRSDATARQKKLERQLEALGKAERLSDELLRCGLTAIPSLSARKLERMAAELGSCELPAAREVFERIALLDRRCRQDAAQAARCRREMLRALRKLRQLLVKGRPFLRELLSSESYSLEEPLLFEAFGGVWNNDELREIGSCRKNALLLQLSFDVTRDEDGRGYTERGFWLELNRGELVRTEGRRAARSLDYAGTDDSCFLLTEVPLLYESPVAPCPRVWWDEAATVEPSEKDFAAALGCAVSVAAAMERARPRLWEPLLPDEVPALLRAGSLGRNGDDFILEDTEGARLLLRDNPNAPGELASVQRLEELPQAAEGGALFGQLYYDEDTRQFCLHPYALVTAEQIFRLQY